MNPIVSSLYLVPQVRSIQRPFFQTSGLGINKSQVFECRMLNTFWRTPPFAFKVAALH